MKLNHILVATDFSPPARRAFEAALTLARATGARLTVAHVHPSVVPIYAALPAEMSRDLLDKEEAVKRRLVRRLEVLVEQAAKARVRANAVYEEGDPVARLLRLARVKRTDLIVAGTHGRGGAAHLLLGSVAEKVVRMAPCSVLVTKRGKWRDRGRVLIALDLSPMAVGVARSGAWLASRLKARFAVLHVLHDTRWVAEAAATSQPAHVLEAITRMGIERGREQVALTLAKAHVKVKPAGMLIREGRAQDVIAKESARGVGLTVVGTHGRKGTTRLLLGSVAEAVVRHARSPVLVLKGVR